MKYLRLAPLGLARLGLAALTLLLGLCPLGAARAAQSQGWRTELEARTAVMWVDAQIFEDLVIGARARLAITWLPRSLQKRLERDLQVDEWVINGINYYYGNTDDVREKIKGRDVLALNYLSKKNWTFNPTDLVVGGYRVTADDILGHPDLRGATGDLPPGVEGTLFLCVPALKPGRAVTVTLGPDSVELPLPAKVKAPR